MAKESANTNNYSLFVPGFYKSANKMYLCWHFNFVNFWKPCSTYYSFSPSVRITFNNYHDSVELVRAVGWLVEPEALLEVGLHLEGVHVGERLLGPGQNLIKIYCVTKFLKRHRCSTSWLSNRWVRVRVLKKQTLETSFKHVPNWNIAEDVVSEALSGWGWKLGKIWFPPESEYI